MKKLLLLLLVGLFLFSCKKKQTIHITAKNAATGEPYPGLTYYLVTYTNINGGTKSKTVATGTLDANGEAIVTERLSKNKGHGVRVVEPENSCYNKNIQLYFSDEENFKAEFEFAECATLQRKVTNINCIDTSDKIEIYIDNTMHSTSNIPWILHGCANSTTSPTQVPIGTYTLHWIVTKNNISTDYYDTFNLDINEYKIYEINY
ncbi:hypothetical protein CW751_06645 [Brumimicrobium salinarum]|uniref:Carboxypeptidase regulatory-like domain-containing protein n=1 Tax=Brumimicrobium salinarum TaxID=2058658 RepID=A0A2I0R3V5_9FLAO|nr:hypothetical protein [Brumimicrobium salinarum]PKR81257.1 hypothetical protein CW751_06645 [Brumimicrobium salinarum]